MAKVKTKSLIQETGPHFGYLKGTVKWAKVLEPGQFGSFSVDMYGGDLLEHKDIFLQLRDDGAKEVKAAGKPYELAEVTKMNDEGEEYIQFKLPENDFEGNPNKIKIFNSFGKEEKDWDKLIGNGSTIKIKYMAKPYYMNTTKMVGVSYRFYAVQVINLVEYEAGDSGFGDESDSAPFEADTQSEDF